MKKKKGRKTISKAKPIAKKVNPFEVHINPKKHSILGQKSKDDHGLPGVSRGKAYKKREETLLPEYRDRHKESKFLDLRLGEKNKLLDPEHKIMMRLAAEKKKQFSKKSLYNLNDDEQLTHGGELLSDENMKDWKTFSDEEDEDLLGASFVKEKHFGGDIFTKPESTNQSEDDKSTSKSKNRKEWIEEIISESKKKKAESKLEKEMQNDAVTKLDAQFQDFLYHMKSRRLTEEDKEKAKKTCEFRDYDFFVNEIAFERTKRAKPTDRLKTEEEIAKEEGEKLRRMEEDRVRRMRGDDVSRDQFLMSADALDEGLELVPRNLISRIPESEKGNSKIELRKKTSNSESKQRKGRSKNEEDSASDDDDKNEGGSGQEEIESEGERRSNMEEDNSDDYSDVLEGGSTDSEETESTTTKGNKHDVLKTSGSPEIIEAERKNSENAISDELPYTFEVPNDYDDFWKLFVGRSPGDVSTIVGRMITCNHPSLGADNKNKVNFVFAYILQTFHIICCIEPEILHKSHHPLSYIDSLIPHLYTITQLNPPDSASALSQVIDEKYEEYQLRRPRRYPHADTFIFLKIAGLLFPASDYHHDVMTRVITFLTQMLGEAKVVCARDIISLMFTASLLFEYLNRSRRFVGELVNALCGVLFNCISHSSQKHLLPHYPPFKMGQSSTLLVVDKVPTEEFIDTKFTLSQLNTPDDGIVLNYNLKTKILNESLQLLAKLARKWTHLSAVRAIFAPIRKLVESIPTQMYPECTKSILSELKSAIEELPSQVPYLKKIEGQLKTLRMMEPTFDRVTEGIKKRGGSKGFQEKQKLIHKLKRERKGAKRELKRDTQFLARQQLKEVLASDAERKRKVNLIMQGLATQESEYKKYKLSK